jgi:hypothetical protein
MITDDNKQYNLMLRYISLVVRQSVTLKERRSRDHAVSMLANGLCSIRTFSSLFSFPSHTCALNSRTNTHLVLLLFIFLLIPIFLWFLLWWRYRSLLLYAMIYLSLLRPWFNILLVLEYLLSVIGFFWYRSSLFRPYLMSRPTQSRSGTYSWEVSEPYSGTFTWMHLVNWLFLPSFPFYIHFIL